MILGETALSFLGLRPEAADHQLGRAPDRSAEHQRGCALPVVALPVMPVILVILAFNFLGDGLRDAADPYR